MRNEGNGKLVGIRRHMTLSYQTPSCCLAEYTPPPPILYVPLSQSFSQNYPQRRGQCRMITVSYPVVAFHGCEIDYFMNPRTGKHLKTRTRVRKILYSVFIMCHRVVTAASCRLVVYWHRKIVPWRTKPVDMQWADKLQTVTLRMIQIADSLATSEDQVVFKRSECGHSETGDG